jgi:hypothetical protein
MVETFAIASVVAVAVYFMLIFLRALLKETHTRHVRSIRSIAPTRVIPAVREHHAESRKMAA